MCAQCDNYRRDRQDKPMEIMWWLEYIPCQDKPMGIMWWLEYIPCTFVGCRKIGGRHWEEISHAWWLMFFQRR